MGDDEGEPAPKLLTVTQAAAIAGVSRQAIHGWIGRGRLKAHASGHGLVIDAAELARLMAVRKAAAQVHIRPATLLGWTNDTNDPQSHLPGQPGSR